MWMWMWTAAAFPPFLLSQLWIENERKSATAGEIESGRGRVQSGGWAEREREKKGSSIIQSLTVGQTRGQWPFRRAGNNGKSQNLTSDLKSETSITLLYMCMFPETAILTAPDAMVASKWPQ